MEAMLKKRIVSKYNRVFTTEFSGESSSEAVAPDVMPDISEILRTSGLVLLRSKTTENGKVSLSASVSASVVYAPDDETGGLYSLRLSIPFAAEAESPEISEECRTVVSIRLSSIDARMLSSRKISVRAEVMISIDCYATEELELVEDVQTEEPAALHVKKEEFELSSISCVREKTFVISDEYSLPPGTGELRDILSPSTTIRVDDIKAVGNKLVFKGSVDTRLLCALSGETQVGEIVFSTAFSQMLEMEELGEDPDTSYALMLTAAYYEPVTDVDRNSSVSMELHVVAQAVSRNRESYSFASDVYSNAYDCSVEASTLERSSYVRRQVVRDTVRQVLSAPGVVREVVFSDARAIAASVDGGKATVKLSVSVVYLDGDGNYRSVRGSVSASFETEMEPDMELVPDAFGVVEIYASPGAEGVELRIPVEMEFMIMRNVGIPIISGIELNPRQSENQPQRPSIALIPRDGKLDLWRVAKLYGSTVELIEQANAQQEGEVPRMLLIPREVC